MGNVFLQFLNKRNTNTYLSSILIIREANFEGLIHN